jgi:hypothetical protein
MHVSGCAALLRLAAARCATYIVLLLSICEDLRGFDWLDFDIHQPQRKIATNERQKTIARRELVLRQWCEDMELDMSTLDIKIATLDVHSHENPFFCIRFFGEKPLSSMLS